MSEEEKVNESSELLVKERELVIPGDKLADGLDFMPSSGCYREGNSIKATGTASVSQTPLADKKKS